MSELPREIGALRPSAAAVERFHPVDVPLRWAAAHANPFLVDVRALLTAQSAPRRHVRVCVSGPPSRTRRRPLPACSLPRR